ncbi:hypothetical protein TSTA_126300 [Talaromyces stipitatus ATCC 10500]|uniref:feruloyl esterase n=1 Tax=Talaromyces stipitatus (strain ATCC 10500 / CBS 375.48 / QM 6759 / NRRL 1006) TaxID=441959 RepID=B8MBD3_TALSN|nr:uncharacterized protein TSTA_126300 [Talaromyces stipitatus ATCC 10500]EED18922.1 hypothetical protein TSTA_126300 [Talaromyces stipitatus ATCC 10500]
MKKANFYFQRNLRIGGVVITHGPRNLDAGYEAGLSKRSSFCYLSSYVDTSPNRLLAFKCSTRPRSQSAFNQQTERWNHSVAATYPFLPVPIQDLNIYDVTVLLTHAGALYYQALNADRSVDFDALIYFSYRSVHDIAIVGKELTRQFYGTKPKYSYWNGCSTEIPGLTWTYLTHRSWSPGNKVGEVCRCRALAQVVMQQEKNFLCTCELKFSSDAGINTCDEMYGVEDRIIADPENCPYDPFHSVGQVIHAMGTTSQSLILLRTTYNLKITQSSPLENLMDLAIPHVPKSPTTYPQTAFSQIPDPKLVPNASGSASSNPRVWMTIV